MFTNPRKTEKEQTKRNHAVNLIIQGTEILGNIKTDGDLRIDGIIHGDVTCDAKLVIGQHGRIVGNVFCQAGEVSGTIEGRISATDILQLSKGADIKGDIEAVRFIVEEGASLSGKCRTAPDLEMQHLLEIPAYEEPKALTQ